MKSTLFLTMLAFGATQVFAQSGNPITQSEKGIYQMMIGNVMKAAEQVPESDYSFKPTESVRTFGQLVAHVADAQYEFCGPVLGENKKSNVEESKTSKADLVAALKESEAYCMKAFDGMTDAKAAETADFFHRKMAKIALLSLNNAHTDEHYGNIVTYMRMKGMTPPSSQH